MHHSKYNDTKLKRKSVTYVVGLKCYPCEWRAPLTSPTHIVELEWIDKDGRTTGGIDIPGICRKSQLGGFVTTDFPFIMPDDAYEQFFALPTIGKALDLLKE